MSLLAYLNSSVFEADEGDADGTLLSQEVWRQGECRSDTETQLSRLYVKNPEITASGLNGGHNSSVTHIRHKN